MTIIVMVTLFLFCVNATNEVEQTVVTISMLCYKNVMNTGQSGWRKTHKRNDNNSSHSHGATRTCQFWTRLNFYDSKLNFDVAI